MTEFKENVKKQIEENDEYPSEGMELLSPKQIQGTVLTGGTFWDYCSNSVVDLIGLGIGACLAGVAWAIWKLALSWGGIP